MKYATLNGTVLGTLDYGLSAHDKAEILAGDHERADQVADGRRVAGILAHYAVDYGKEAVPLPKVVVDGGAFLLDKVIDGFADGFNTDHSGEANARVAAVLDDREGITSELAVAAAYQSGILPDLDRFRLPDGSLKPMEAFDSDDWLAWNGTDINGRTGTPDQVAASYAVTHRADYDAAAFGDAAKAAYLDGYTGAVHKLG